MIDTNSENEKQVITDILAGDGRSLSQAARRFPPYRQNKPVSLSTVYRWITRGVRLRDGTILRLEGARLGGRWLTSGPAIERFISRQTPNFDTSPAPPPRTEAQRERAATRAAKALDDIGI